MWVPPEIKDPVLRHASTRKSVACFGAVSLSTGKFVRAMCSVFNAETFQSFLKKLLRHRSRGKRMVIVLDNAKYHHAVLLAPFLRKHRGILSLLFLPPYSPQLAPIERVEAYAPTGHAQPILRHARRSARRRQHLLRQVAKPQFCATTSMLHYLRRYV